MDNEIRGLVNQTVMQIHEKLNEERNPDIFQRQNGRRKI